MPEVGFRVIPGRAGAAPVRAAPELGRAVRGGQGGWGGPSRVMGDMGSHGEGAGGLRAGLDRVCRAKSHLAPPIKGALWRPCSGPVAADSKPGRATCHGGIRSMGTRAGARRSHWVSRGLAGGMERLWRGGSQRNTRIPTVEQRRPERHRSKGGRCEVAGGVGAAPAGSCVTWGAMERVLAGSGRGWAGFAGPNRT